MITDKSLKGKRSLRETRERKMTHTILILILLNMICWIPYQLANIVIFEVLEGKYEKWHYDIVVGLYFTQYGLNFFVYVLRSEQYRKSFSYCWRKTRQDVSDSFSRIRDESSTTITETGKGIKEMLKIDYLNLWLVMMILLMILLAVIFFPDVEYIHLW